MSREDYYLKVFHFSSGAQVSKMVEDKRMLVGVFMTSFRFCLWGVKEEEGRAMGTYTYVVNDVQKGFFSLQASFSLLSCISADHPAFPFRQSVLIYQTPKARSLIHKMPPKNGSNCSFTKAAKGLTRYTLVKYAVNKV